VNIEQELKEIKESLKIIRNCLQVLVRRMVYQQTKTPGNISIKTRLEEERDNHNASDLNKGGNK